MNIQKGDLVTISANSKYYNENSDINPRNMLGRVTRTPPSGTEDMAGFSRLRVDDYRVMWNSGHSNSYNHKDLELLLTKEDENSVLSERTISIDKVLSKDERVDLKALSSYNSYEEAEMSYEDTALLLSRYETALKRAEETISYLKKINLLKSTKELTEDDKNLIISFRKSSYESEIKEEENSEVTEKEKEEVVKVYLSDERKEKEQKRAEKMIAEFINQRYKQGVYAGKGYKWSTLKENEVIDEEE